MLQSPNLIPLAFSVLGVLLAVISFYLSGRVRLHAAITHMLSFTFLFCVIGAAGRWIMLIEQMHLIILVVFFLLGMWHTWSVYRFQTWSRKENYLAEVCFTLVIFCLGEAGYLWLFQLVNDTPPSWLMAGTALPFLLPFLLHKAYLLWQSIPDKIYYVWQHSEHLNTPTPAEGDTIMMHFLMKKGDTNAKDSKFTVKAPLNMKIGDIFHYFLNNYNQQNTGEPVLANSKSTPFGWYFYVKTGWISRESVNPNISVFRNQLREDTHIYAKRVYLDY